MFKPSCSLHAPSSTSSTPRTSREEEGVKYKGVRLRKWGKWVSEIRLPNSRERIWLGSYDSPEKAARAFDVAQFCLRGNNAKFNFAHDLPADLVGGRSLTPAEIQAIASQYANNYNHEEQQLQQQTQEDDQEVINEKDDDLQSEISPLSSNSDGAFQMDTINWSFLDLLEPNETAPITHTNLPDYDNWMLSGLDHMHEDIYTTAHIGSPEVDDQYVDENYCHQSFLWNF